MSDSDHDSDCDSDTSVASVAEQKQQAGPRTVWVERLDSDALAYICSHG